MRYFIELAYDGTAYHGWQTQPEVISVQEAVEKALSLLLKKSMNIVAAGRTDAGVHALQMFAHFDYDKIIDNSLIPRLNSFYQKILLFITFFKLAMMLMPGLMPVQEVIYIKLLQSKIHFL